MSLSKNNKINAIFLKFNPRHGNITLVSQSGAICTATIEDAIARIRFTEVVSMGNKADMDEDDALESLTDDPETRVIMLYLEDINDGRRFMEIVKKITKEKKPTIALKAGRSAACAKAVMSHTEVLLGSDQIYDAYLLNLE